MGILLDGDGYKQTKNTRDREVGQIGVLKNLGWVLRRVWTIDWWDNRDKELKKLVTQLEELKEASEKKHEADASAENTSAEKARETEAAIALQAELEKQIEEVIAEEQEAEEEQQVHVVVETSDSGTTAEREKSAGETTGESGEESVGEVAEGTREESAESSVAETVEETAEEPTGETITEPAVKLPESSKSVQDIPLASAEKEASSIQALLEKLQEEHAEVIDKRENGGALWIVGGQNLTPIMNSFQEMGIHFLFKAGGGKATGGRDGWWAKTDIVLPEIGNSTERIIKETTEPAEKVETVLETNVSVMSEKAVASGLPVEPQESSSTPAVEKVAEKKAVITPVPYTYADLPKDRFSVADYASADNKAEIGKRALIILEAEAPILRDVLIRKVMASFGVYRSPNTSEATEKAFKAAKIKTTKQKGIVYCWAPNQDPKEYYGLRVSNERSGDEICPQEMRNAVVYALKTKGELSKDDLIKETSLVLGYKRLGKNLEAALTAGIQYARSSGAIIYVPGGTFKLP